MTPPSLGALRRRLFEALLARDETGPRFRTLAVAVAFTVLWGLAAAVERPAPDPETLQQWLGDPSALSAVIIRPFVYALYAIFHPSVWRHLIVPALVLGWALYTGAHYLNNLFELKGDNETLNYVLGALFGGAYEELEIKEGGLTAESRQRRVHTIGGPGYVKVHLGNAALFERPSGASAVYSATPQQFLRGFERLREEVIDLRDQIRQLDDMKVYTKDGVPVTAIQATVVFRVRGNQTRSKDLPYPYDETAVRRLIYGQLVGPEHRAKPWANTMEDLAREEIANYVGRHLLKELIAQKQKGSLPPPPTVIQDTSRAQSSPPTRRASATANARQPLTLSFYTDRFARRCDRLGVQLIWIGVGTLETPEEITQELVSAWYSEYEAIAKTGALNLQEERRKVRNSALMEFFRSLRDFWVERTRSPDLQKTVPQEDWPTPFDVVRLYAIKLRELRHSTNHPLEHDVDPAIRYLDQLAQPHFIGGLGLDFEDPDDEGDED